MASRTEVESSWKLGQASDSVEVNAAAPLLETASGEVSYAAEEQKVATLPLDGRNFIPLVALSPGVALPGGGSLLPRINGSRPRTNEYLYDGISVLQPEPGQVAFYPIIDAHRGVQAQHQRLLAGIRPFQRRNRHGGREIRRQRSPRRAVRVHPQRRP